MNDVVFSKSFRFHRFSYDRYHYTDNSRGAPYHYIAYMEKGRCKIVSERGTREFEAGEIITLQIFADSSRHSSYNQVEAEKLHQFGMNKIVDRDSLFPSITKRCYHIFVDAHTHDEFFKVQRIHVFHSHISYGF